MWFYLLASRHLHWSAAVLKKFFKLVPVPTLSVVVLTLVSQSTRMLAFFLPLKVIILIGSTGIPHYFPSSWATFDKDVLVVALSLATILCYLIYLLVEKLLGITAEKGARGVVERSRKLVLFSNQDEVASQAYQKLAAGLATGVLAGLLGVLFAVLYPAFLGVMVAYVAGVSLLLSLMTQARPVLRDKLKEAAKSLIDLLSGAGFMLLFAFMVADFLLWEGVGFMVAIISLLLSRQLFNRLESVLKDAIWLHDKRLQINAIFFSGHRLETSAEDSRHRKLWELLSLNESPEPLIPLLERVIGASLPAGSSVTCQWRQSGIIDILVFDVELQVPESEPQGFLLKVFGSRHKKAALNEADLLASSTSQDLPTLELLGVEPIDGHDAHLFRSSSGAMASREEISRRLPERLARCWQVEPGKGLIARYRRSHPLLHQRLSPRMLERLAAVATLDESRDHVDRLGRRFDAIQAELGKLPLALFNPGVPRELTFQSDSGELQLAHWGNWALEPVGAEASVGGRWAGRLEQAFEAAAKVRADLREVPRERVRLCALCSHFEALFKNQKYADATALIPEMLACLAKLEPAPDMALYDIPRES